MFPCRARLIIEFPETRNGKRLMSAKLKVPTGFDDASEGERIEFVQELWDRIAQNAADVPIPNDHKRILDERLDAYAAEPRLGRPWPEVRDELLSKLRS